MTTKQLGGNTFSPDDPMPVSAGGYTLCEKNVAVGSIGAASKVLIAASSHGARHTTLINTGTVAVNLAFGADADATNVSLAVGAIKETDFLGAINGFVASGSGTIFVLAVAKP